MSSWAGCGDAAPWRAEDSMLTVFAMWIDLQGTEARPEQQQDRLATALPAPLYRLVMDAGSAWDAALDGSAIEPAPLPSPVDYDLRRADPYSAYDDFDFRVPVETSGDCLARYRVRMVEFRESLSIVRQVLDKLPEGPVSSRPGLKSVAQTRIPKGEAYARIEGPRGEVGCYLIADGKAKPYRMKWRGASFSNLAVLPHIIPGHKVSDVVATMGSVDPVFGEVDR